MNRVNTFRQWLRGWGLTSASLPGALQATLQAVAESVGTTVPTLREYLCRRYPDARQILEEMGII